VSRRTLSLSQLSQRAPAGSSGRRQGAGQRFAGEPDFSAVSLIFLQSPDTMASIARRTLAEMRFCGPAGTSGGGLSSAASARLAGVPGGVMFSMPATVGACRWFATHCRDFLQIAPARR
jgi:hypothetical protein